MKIPRVHRKSSEGIISGFKDSSINIEVIIPISYG